MHLSRLLCGLGLCLLLPAAAQDSPPQLLIDPQGHSGSVKQVFFRSGTDELISVGDKTIRFWDVASGELVRTMRGQLGEGADGQLQAAALSADERYLAVGGIDPEKAIRIIDLEADRVVAVLRAHENTILCLDFSDDGLWLASGSIDTDVLVWDLSGLADAETPLELSEPERLDAHEEPVYALDFAPDGLRLVTGGDDDQLILWQRETTADGFEILATGTEHTDDVSAVAFSPAGSLILSGGFDHELKRGEGETGEYREPTDADLGSSIHAIAFSTDGQRALVSSASGTSGVTAVYDLATNTRLVEFEGHDNRVHAAAWHPERNLVATGGGDDHDIFLWHPDADADAEIEAGEVLHQLVGDGRANWSVAFHDTREAVVAFGRTYSAENDMATQDLEYAFDFRNFEFVEDGDYTRTLDTNGDLTLEKTEDNTIAIGEDDVLETSRSVDGLIRTFTYLPDASQIVVGGSFRLKSFDAAPNAEGGHDELNEFVGHSGEVKAVSPSPDGRLLASASDDQTVRLWNVETGELLASLFVTEDREWVCWTPSGHYHASPGGERYIGWHFNRGMNQLGEFFPSYVFRDAFHRPDLVAATVQLGSFSAALGDTGAEEVDIDAMLPPRIEWVSPHRARGTEDGHAITVQARLHSPNGELSELKLLLNGKAIHHYELSDGTEFDYEEEIELNPGENRLTLFASNVHAGHTSEERVIFVPTGRENATDPDTTTNTPATTDDGLDKLLKPNLYMLAVGVSDFANGDISDLEYCDDDATAMAEFFAGQEGGLFAKTEIRLLTNADATEAAIQEGLDWLEKSATQKDFVVLFLASHGMNDEKGKFYMIPHDCDPESLRSSAVAWEDFGEILGNLPSRVLMFLDTCHSGRLGANLFSMANKGNTRSIGGLKSAFDNSEAIRELTSDEVGVVIMAASTGNESSLENPEWGHGAFTTGVLAGLKGEADLNGDGIVHLIELDFFVAEKVKELTDGAQHPTTVKPSTISRLPVAAVAE
jgi:WD40 repeat protein